MNISIVGTGYVGLISGACLASKGHQVTCIDILEEKVEMINDAKSPIYEIGLDPLLQKVVLETKKLSATTNFEEAVLRSDLTMIAVGTPFDGQRIDLTYIKKAAEQIGTALKKKAGYHVVIVKSTVVPGTTEEVVLPIVEAASGKKAGIDFGVGMNPEFLREGDAISDFMTPDRIVLGGIDDKTIDTLDQMYSAFPDVDKIRTTPKTAEMIKYTANSLLALLISFSNEIGNLCTAVGQIDVKDVLQGVSLDKRFSPILPNGRVTPSMVTYLEAGCGFGGSCFPKDVKALIEYGREKGSPTRILQSAIELNLDQPKRLVLLLQKHYPKLEGIKIAVLGLAFKPGTDDIRESPSLIVIEDLLQKGANVKAFDPIAMPNCENYFAREKLAPSFEPNLAACIEGVDAIVLVTSWPEFKEIPGMIANFVTTPLVVDGRRFLEKTAIKRYEGIGL